MSRIVAVQRSGGFAGMTRAGEVDLDSDDERVPELRALVSSVDLGGVGDARPRADGFVYRFDLCGDTASVPEQALTSDLRRVIELVLG
ncbi:hypothetical protein P5P86_04515 [Nocardioides sp. BP30]|uniref:protealysin inhibitor emfourin n=1 Tax=Nocardioides sp. BP30 TaxID=3036374 RepID=UPI002469B9AC|nr:protealysin inhibitor emfourin [Nocardioides sp. BP30]WGL53088.1 hypothetical protein P5P86_04515 [Nocardioides sp. BP30]